MDNVCPHRTYNYTSWIMDEAKFIQNHQEEKKNLSPPNVTTMIGCDTGIKFHERKSYWKFYVCLWNKNFYFIIVYEKYVFKL